jgi:hypothetical protein
MTTTTLDEPTGCGCTATELCPQHHQALTPRERDGWRRRRARRTRSTDGGTPLAHKTTEAP